MADSNSAATIECPQCEARYRVDIDLLERVGGRVKCKKCYSTWKVNDSSNGIEHEEPEDSGAETTQEDSESDVNYEDSQPQEGGDEAVDAAEDGEDGGDHEANADDAQAGDFPVIKNVAAELQNAQLQADLESAAPLHPRAKIRWWEYLRSKGGAGGAGGNKPRTKQYRISRVAAVTLLFSVAGGYFAWSSIMEPHAVPAATHQAQAAQKDAESLRLGTVSYRKEMRDGETSIFVYGDIVNETQYTWKPPNLRFIANDASDNELLAWNWDVGGEDIAPGETLHFRSRFVTLPSDTDNILVELLDSDKS